MIPACASPGLCFACLLGGPIGGRVGLADAGTKGFAVASGRGLFEAVLPFVPDPEPEPVLGPEPSLSLRSSKTAAPATVCPCIGQVEY